MISNIYKNYAFPITIGALLALTLVGGPDYLASRSFKEGWNIGHIILFSLFTLYILKYCQILPGRKLIFKIIFIIFVVGILSILIEFSQFIFKNGTPDLADVRRNFVGAALGFIFTIRLKNKYILAFLKVSIYLIILFELLPVSLALADEIRVIRKFPVLSDFESRLELSRWSGRASFTSTIDVAFHGNKSLLINFGTTKYSGISLNYLRRDWTEYSFLKFEIYYPENDSLSFTCRIHDGSHTKGNQAYNDRFNHQYVLHYGWNEISIPLNDIENAPKSRKMDMTDIRAIGIFTIRLPESKRIYLDYVRLE